MKSLKKLGLAFLSCMFFAILCIAMMLFTNIVFNKNSSYFDRYNDFEFQSGFEVVTNEEI